MDHRDFIQSLSAEQRRGLTAKSNLEGFKGLMLHWGLILLVGGLIALKIPYWQLLLPVQGVLVIFLFTLMHETIHRTVFATRPINDVVAIVCAIILMLPAGWFRQFHMEHHRHTQDEQRDPELQSAKPQTLRQYLWHVSGIPIWASHISTLVRNARGRCDDAFVPKSKLRQVHREAQVMLVIYAFMFGLSLVSGSLLLLYVWIIPAILGQPFLRVYLLAEHGKCPLVANAFENTRTTFTNVLMRRLAWNMPYHSEHHAYPMVPFFRLGELHKMVQAYLSVTEKGYVRFNSKYVAALNSDD